MSLFYIDACADTNDLKKVVRIPIRQAEATVRFSAPNLFRHWGPMNAIARLVQTNPGNPHGIVGSWRNYQLVSKLARISRFGEQSGIECVIGIGRDAGDVQLACRSLFDILR